jgi:hypothetical protein
MCQEGCSTFVLFLWASHTWTDAYPDSTAAVEYLRKALLKAAMHLKVNEMVDRLSNDAEYGMALSGLVCHSLILQISWLILTHPILCLSAQCPNQYLACPAEEKCGVGSHHKLQDLAQQCGAHCRLA